MNKKLYTIPIIAALCLFFIIGGLFTIKSYQGIDKTIVVEDMADSSANSSSHVKVTDVKLQKLDRKVYGDEMYGLWSWSKDKLIAEYINPWFKFDEKKKKIPVESFMFPQASKDYSKNGLYLVKPENGNLEPLAETADYNYTWAYTSPDKSKVIFHECYTVIGGNEEYKVANSMAKASEPFTVSSYSDVKDRIRIYDSDSGSFTPIDEWEPKYFINTYEYGRIGLQRAFCGVGWSFDSKNVIYGQKVSPFQYIFTVYNLESGEKTQYRMSETKGRYTQVRVTALSKDGRRLYFRGLTGPGKGYLDGFIGEDTESALYVYDLDKTVGGPIKLMDNTYDCKILSDENTVIYMDNPIKSIYKSKLYVYDMSKKQSRLVNDHAMPHGFDISRDEKWLSYMSLDGNSFDVNITGTSAVPEVKSTLVYKAGRNATMAAPPLWREDDSKIAVSYFTDLDTPDSTGQICILTLSK